MVKPQVYVPGGWTGGLDFQSPDEWQAWEADYRRYILSFAALAAEEHAELFCIGTEFRQALRKRPAFWTALIAEIRAIYAGKLTYSANWDDWEQVPFWSQLDYIGLGAYYPLINEPTPSIAALTAAWQPIVQKLAIYANQHRRPVLFTEFGYLSVDGSGWRNWELESAISSRPINQEAQANCLSALLATWLPQPFWAGGFLWKWFPNMRGHEGYPERDYTPKASSAKPCCGATILVADRRPPLARLQRISIHRMKGPCCPASRGHARSCASRWRHRSAQFPSKMRVHWALYRQMPSRYLHGQRLGNDSQDEGI